MSITSSKLKEFHDFLDRVIELQEQGVQIQLKSKEVFVKAVEIMREAGMGDFEISELVREYLRKRIPETSLRRYLEELKPEEPEEEIEESTSQSPPPSPIDDKNDIEQQSEIAVTTTGQEIIETPNQAEEEPSELELAQIRIQQLEDALKKTEQFKPATQLQGQVETFPPLQEEEVFDWLGKRDNGVSCYWYPNYGIELFKTRIFTQLKGRGVTTFKRLYFEV